MILIGAGIAIPLAGALLTMSGTSLLDLAELVPIGNSAENYVVLNWSSLLRNHPHALDAGSTLFNGAPVRALGYMVDGDHPSRPGEWVRDFILLPEAGNWLHPAHRFGDQMIAVHLEPDAQVRFSSRDLVWVRGTFRAAAGDAAGSEPLYSIERARVQPAETREIRKYFK